MFFDIVIIIYEVIITGYIYPYTAEVMFVGVRNDNCLSKQSPKNPLVHSYLRVQNGQGRVIF